MGIPVGIVTHRSRSLTGTGNYRFESEVHNCQVLVTGTCKICFSEIYIIYDNFFPLVMNVGRRYFYQKGNYQVWTG